MEARTEGRKGAVQGQPRHSRGCCRASSPQEPCPVGSPAGQRSQQGSVEPRKLHCLLSVPFSRDREENCGAKLYSNCLKRKGDDCLNSRLQTLSSITLPCSAPLLWKAESMAQLAPKYVLLDRNPEIYTWKHQRWGKIQQKPCPICCGPRWARKSAESYFQHKHNHHPQEQGGTSKIQGSKSLI